MKYANDACTNPAEGFWQGESSRGNSYLCIEEGSFHFPAARNLHLKHRWEHCDESKKMSSSAVHLGDKIMMIADFTNLPEGHSVSFDIYDMSEPGLRIDSVRSKNQNGSAKAEWTISDKTNNDLPPKLSFEVIARSKTSERVNIDLEELDEFNFSM